MLLQGSSHNFPPFRKLWETMEIIVSSCTTGNYWIHTHTTYLENHQVLRETYDTSKYHRLDR